MRIEKAILYSFSKNETFIKINFRVQCITEFFLDINISNQQVIKTESQELEKKNLTKTCKMKFPFLQICLFSTNNKLYSNCKFFIYNQTHNKNHNHLQNHNHIHSSSYNFNANI
jgi:hypothetical protein